MEKSVNESKVDKNPRETAGLFSRATFSWMNPLLMTGYQRPLDSDDLYELSDEDQAQQLVDKMKKVWRNEIRTAKESKRPPRLWRALLRLHSWQTYVLILLLRFTITATYVTNAIFVWYLLEMLANNSIQIYSKVLVASGLSASILISCFVSNLHDFQTYKVGMCLKIALTESIHKEILRRKRYNLSDAELGRIQNMIANDVNKIAELMGILPAVFTAPFDLILLLLTMGLFVGWYSLFGAFVICIPLILTSVAAKYFSKLKTKQMLLTDKRLAIVHEIISGIRAVKAFAYEDNYMDAVDDVRREETKLNYLKSIFYSANNTLATTLDAVSGLVAIALTIYSGVRLGASNIFTLTTLLGNITFIMLINVDYGTRILQEAAVSVGRIGEFLCETAFKCKDVVDTNGTAADETCKDAIVSRLKSNPATEERHNSQEDVSTAFIRMNDLSASWINTDDANILHSININTEPNELIIVTGRVGSGKSSLLMAIQGEIPATSGTLSTKGYIAYVPQIPWIFSGTVRDNITFGKPYDENKYQRILDGCDLQQDIQRFPKGDQSMIGQRGVMLSGGQRARVSLARAVYSDADIFLMDDPLSAVDVKVGQRIFEKCICEELSSRLRVVVTHQLQYLDAADRIITMRNGSVEFQGSYEELKQTGVIQVENMANANKESTSDITTNEFTQIDEQESEIPNDLCESEEDRVTGQVTWKVYWSFLRAGSPTIALMVFVIYYILVQGVLYSPNLFQSWLAHMTYGEQRNSTTIGVYCGLVMGALLLCSIRDYLGFVLVIRSARNLHPSLTKSVIKSPVLFFDTNPLGRIMNRFSSDIDNLDDKMPRYMNISLSYTVKAIGVLFVSLYASIWFLIVIVPLVIGSQYYSRYMLRNSREICRLEAISRSPVFAHVSETERGLEVIRSLRMESDFTCKMLRYLDDNTRAMFLRLSLNRWFALRIDCMCCLLTMAIIIIGVAGVVDPALTGTLLTITISLVGILQYGIRMACEVENSMTSAERVLAYSSLPPEPGYNVQSKPPESWPDLGLVSLHNVSLQYVDNGVMVLENLNLEVQPKEKIGIVGRTGAGKSSLFAAILRMPEPRGQILIDGVDLAHINIQLARRSMAVISQDPFLFAGTLKRNLDPFDRFTDDEIWTALTHVQLSSKIATLHGQLDCAVGMSGTGFSVGERQLLCLARALLQKSRILLMDEATANVDYKTDQLIQQTIRDKFTDCTVLTIAHRLNTIMDYDRVVVMDQGHVVEQGEPAILVGKESGYLNKLMKMSGIAT